MFQRMIVPLVLLAPRSTYSEHISILGHVFSASRLERAWFIISMRFATFRWLKRDHQNHLVLVLETPIGAFKNVGSILSNTFLPGITKKMLHKDCSYQNTLPTSIVSSTYKKITVFDWFSINLLLVAHIC